MEIKARGFLDNNKIMRSIYLGIILAILFTSFYSCVSGVTDSDSKPISHDIWDNLLKKHVSDDGIVNYQGFIADSLELNEYIAMLSNNHPNDKNWNDNEQQAYWINAYNAFTVQLIIRNYPVKSIKDLGGGIYKVNTSWDIQFIHIEDQTYDLNNIEHGILRKKWSEPRVHFAVNCASVSCPRLRNEAFTAQLLDRQLDKAAIDFINNSSKNYISEESAELSRIFKWFKGDFTENTTLIEFINQFSNIKLNDDTKIEFKEYNWNLNE